MAMESEKRSLPRWPPIEPTAPTEIKPLPDAWLRIAPMSEPERPTRWVWIVLGVTVLFALTAGGGCWLIRSEQVPVIAQANAPLNAAAKPVSTAAEGPAIPPPQLAVGLPPLTGQRSSDDPAAMPGEPRSSVPMPSQPPRLAVGLPPITEQVPPAVPAPTAEPPPPAGLLPTTVPQPQPSRKAAVRGSPPTPSPSQSSGSVKF
jgi:hypothetical protein